MSKKVGKRYQSKNKNKSETLCWDAWRDAIYRRDGHKCQTPDITPCSGSLNPHHCVVSAAHNITKYEVDNGLTLCNKHHKYGAHSEKPDINVQYTLLVIRRIGKERFEELLRMRHKTKQWKSSDYLSHAHYLNSLYR